MVVETKLATRDTAVPFLSFELGCPPSRTKVGKGCSPTLRKPPIPVSLPGGAAQYHSVVSMSFGHAQNTEGERVLVEDSGISDCCS